MNTIDIIVPLYISHPSLYSIVGEFFNSLKEFYPDANLIVVDDCSPMPHNFPVTFKNEKNIGFTGTVNKGLSLSTSSAIVIANDDLKFKKGDLDRFYSIKGLGIFSPRDTASGNLETFGAIWGMTRETFDKLGYLSERFPHYYSDTEYYERAKKEGVPVIKWKDICVEHRESATYKFENKEELLK